MSGQRRSMTKIDAKQLVYRTLVSVSRPARPKVTDEVIEAVRVLFSNPQHVGVNYWYAIAEAAHDIRLNEMLVAYAGSVSPVDLIKRVGDRIEALKQAKTNVS
jgi:hypothetical protein